MEEISDEIFDDKTHEEIDLLFTDEVDEKLNQQGQFIYQLIGDFEVVAVMSPNHHSAEKSYLTAGDFREVNLLTYPTDKEKLDVYKHILIPKNINPKSVKQVINSHKLLQMVAANMGIAVVPKWLVNGFAMQALLEIKPLGKSGLYKSLFVRYRNTNEQLNVIDELLIQIKNAFTHCVK